MTGGASHDQPDEILRAVWQVIAERGISEVSMRTVARTAGVSLGRVQYRFRTKADLLRASLEEMLSEAVAQHGEATTGADASETLWHLLVQTIPRGESTRVGVSIFYQYAAAGISYPALAQLLSDAKVGAEGEATRLIGALAPHIEDPRAVARSLIATADGLALRVLLGGLPGSAAVEALRTSMARDHPYLAA